MEEIDEVCAYHYRFRDQDKCTKHLDTSGYRCAMCREYIPVKEYFNEILKEWEVKT